ncbi:MAG: ATP-dependent ligase [Nocardioidaceae bacterium]|nr:ATP-dependent ligase [Nocardioidaceae bacterium]
MLLSDLVATSAAVSSTRSRTAKRDLLAAALRQCDADEIEVVVAYLSGEVRQRRTGVGWRSLAEKVPPAPDATLTVLEVDAALDRLAALAGAGSQAERRAAVAGLFGRATTPEQAFLRGLLTGELRQGALDGVVLDALAPALGVPAAEVRRAAMLLGSTAAAAGLARRAGSNGLAAVRLEVGRPVRPMLAASAPDITSALTRLSPAAGPVVVDLKLDGIRLQVHKEGDQVLVVTRSLDDITARVPEVVERVRELPARSLVLDGEAIALRPDGRPQPFQITAARTASGADVAALRRRTPLTTVLFDVLHHDGDDLLDAPLTDRAGRLARLLSGPASDLLVPRITTSDLGEAQRFFEAAVAAGHEGAVVKASDAPYAAGRRGSAWIKVKPRHTLDLVVLAAEWGSGRRVGWLSNLHLGARAATGDARFIMLGKTFKGLTDELLSWQTEQLLEREVRRTGHVVHVRPELVVEIAFDGVQSSSRYPGGVALRFARVLRYRDDKTAEDADTLDSVLALHDPV